MNRFQKVHNTNSRPISKIKYDIEIKFNYTQLDIKNRLS